MNDNLNKQERIDYEIFWLKEQLKEVNSSEQETHRAWLNALIWVNNLKEEGNL